jgi:hypothetical protein
MRRSEGEREALRALIEGRLRHHLAPAPLIGVVIVPTPSRT